ncbi:MAG: hypothetical protein J6Z38_00100 [Lachnospiraceae bacterium]|nr:hypothetical protein [Lachnospiraceae bacterium]
MKKEPVCFIINDQIRHQKVRYFGESACWWGSGIGCSEKARKVLRLLHTDEGLGLNVIRLNVGGSIREDRSDAPYPAPSLNRRAPLSPLKEDRTYDIHRDEGMLCIAKEALKLGTIDDFTLFMNSPPSCMTINGLTCGNEPTEGEKYVSNLARSRYSEYAEYVADVTELYLNEGIPIRYVSPINEPQWQWDRNNRQEGCHYEADEVLAFLQTVVRVFLKRAERNPAFSNVKISMPETAQWYYPKEYTFGLYERICKDPLIRDYADHFAAHSYGTNADHKREFKEFVEKQDKRLPLHQTEWGPLHDDSSHPMEFALEMANCMYEDLTILDVPHWTWWTGLSGMSFPSGLISEDPNGDDLIATKRYYTMMQHSRFIKGCTRIDVVAEENREDYDAETSEADDDGTLKSWNTIAEKRWKKTAASAYVSEDERSIRVVLINNLEQVSDILVRVSERFEQKGRLFLTDADHDCQDMGVYELSRKLELPSLSVGTLVIGRLEGDNG